MRLASHARVAAARGALALAALLLAAGCATLAPLEPPRIESTSVRVVSVALPAVTMAVVLVVANPNAREVTITALDVRMTVGGERVAVASLPSPVTLAASATTPVTLDARADMSVALAGLGRALGAARPLDYEVAGEATLADGRRIPFRRRGETGGSRS